ncbi:MAG: FAD-dependent oxidoreductase [Polyangiaceae bacterium]
MTTPDVLVVGGGIFGISAALELEKSGARVLLLEPGPIPHPDASTTDISKLVRVDYGVDDFYVDLMERALPRWRAYDEELDQSVFHETGILLLSHDSLSAETFEGASHRTLAARGYELERLAKDRLAARFPAWRADAFADSYYNPVGGWAESGVLLAALAQSARRRGVDIREGVRVRPRAADARGARVTLESGDTLEAGAVVIAAGAFTPTLLPKLADRLFAVGQPVYHFEVPSEPAYAESAFPPWAADIARTGFYGFPPHAGVLKIANHGPGIRVDPSAPRVVSASTEPMFRAFLRAALPSVAGARVVRTRLCLYCDSFDGDFFIDRDPEDPSVVVAAGGSGHAFKFAPVLGELIANAVAGRAEARFRWRELGERRFEGARHAGTTQT